MEGASPFWSPSENPTPNFKPNTDATTFWYYNQLGANSSLFLTDATAVPAYPLGMCAQTPRDARSWGQC